MEIIFFPSVKPEKIKKCQAMHKDRTKNTEILYPCALSYN